MPRVGQKVIEPRLAVNLYDVDRIDPAIRPQLLGEGEASCLDGGQPIDMQYDRKNKTEVGVPFRCPLLQAALICDLLRSHDREAGDFPTRLYMQRNGGPWIRVPSYVVLTVADAEGKVSLNPTIFKGHAPLAKKVEVTPLAPTKVF